MLASALDRLVSRFSRRYRCAHCGLAVPRDEGLCLDCVYDWCVYDWGQDPHDEDAIRREDQAAKVAYRLATRAYVDEYERPAR